MTVTSCPRANEATAQALLAWSAASTSSALRAVITIAGRRRIRGHATWRVVVAPLELVLRRGMGGGCRPIPLAAIRRLIRVAVVPRLLRRLPCRGGAVP